MEILEDYVKKYPEPNKIQVEPINVNEEFLRFLNSGIYSQALAEFMR